MLTPFLLVALLAGYFLRDGLLPMGSAVEGRSFHATLKGRVVAGNDHTPVAEAEIRVGALSTVSGRDGAFELAHGDFIGRRLHVQVHKAGFQVRHLAASVASEVADLGTIRIQRAVFLTGRVVSADLDAPVPAATVILVRPPAAGGNLVGQTEGDGRYRLGPVLEGEPFKIRVEHPAYLPVEKSGQAVWREDRDTAVTVALPMGGVISGATCLDSRERYSGVHVMAFGVESDGSAGEVEKAGLSAADGTFILQGLRPGEKVLRAETADGDLRSLPVRVTVPAAGEVTGVRMILLPPERR